jgi:hypothetical protein
VLDSEEILILLVSKTLSWAGNKPRERIFLVLRGILLFLRRTASSSISSVVKEYYNLHLFALLYSVFGFPSIIILFTFLHITYLWLLTIIVFVPIVAPLLTEYLWKYVAKGNPSDYFRILELKSRNIYKYFGFLVLSYAVSLSLIFYLLFLRNADLILLSLVIFVIVTLMLIGFSIFFEFNSFYRKRCRFL